MEALSTLAEWPDTSQGDVATRLLVDKSTVSVWVQKSRGQPNQLLTPGIVDAGQLARRTGDLNSAPFVVGALDEEPFIRASLGELKYWLQRERTVARPDLDEWERVVRDGSLQLAHRWGVVEEAREVLRAAAPDLFTPPRP